ncbi:MAG: Beta-lactamase OXA-1 [Chlamydiia bacterium]|nr:Beta-lactamase OXA-1 [Chlamydiia bacterium]
MKAFLLTFLLPIFLSAGETFILIDLKTHQTITQLGTNIDARVRPGCTFNIFLSLIGFEQGVLIDSQSPIMAYQEGYPDYLPIWKQSHTPTTWMQYSVVWYSQEVAKQIQNIDDWLNRLDYGNCDLSLGPHHSPLTETLAIALSEQTEFLYKMLSYQLPLSKHAVDQTKQILYRETLLDTHHLFGKTGWTKEQGEETAWFIGWLETPANTYIFAYLLQEEEIPTDHRIERTKALLHQFL